MMPSMKCLFTLYVSASIPSVQVMQLLTVVSIRLIYNSVCRTTRRLAVQTVAEFSSDRPCDENGAEILQLSTSNTDMPTVLPLSHRPS